MGVCQSQRRLIITNNALVDQLMRIRMVCQQHQLKGARELKVQEGLLVQVFGNDVGKRSRLTEKAMIGRTVYSKNMLLVYKYIQAETRKLLERKGLLDDTQNEEIIMPSINLLVYCSAFVQQQCLSRFRHLIIQKYQGYKIPQDTDISYSLIKYHRYTEQVTFQMENTFILAFSSEYGIPVSQINEVGHTYEYAAGRISYEQPS